MSENCASGIGTAAGWMARACRNGDGGESSVGRGTVSAPGGGAGTARVAMVGRRAIVLTARAWAALVSVAVLLAVPITGASVVGAG